MAELDGTRARIIKALRPLDAVSVENYVGPGTPDVNYTEGWIELKWLRAWPKRPGTPVILEHYSPEQRAWALKRRRVGGQVWMLLQVRQEWLLIDGAVAALTGFGRTLNRQQLCDLADHYWPRGLREKELIQCILQRQSDFSSIVAEHRSHKAPKRR